jgi:hypothetical protein
MIFQGNSIEVGSVFFEPIALNNALFQTFETYYS